MEIDAGVIVLAAGGIAALGLTFWSSRRSYTMPSVEHTEKLVQNFQQAMNRANERANGSD